MSGLCECGCGEKTRVATYDDPRKGYVKGQPRRFVRGHHHRLRWATQSYLVDLSTGCWTWQGTKVEGYGRTRDGARAHCAFYERVNGAVPDGLELDHTCRNPACVNPAHLEAIPHAENTRRGRTAKLTWETVRQIRALHESHEATARRYAVDPTTISRIRRRERWWPDTGATL